jgi:serine protease Do
MPSDRTLAVAEQPSRADPAPESELEKLGLKLAPGKDGGVRIVGVVSDSAAAQHGLSEGDVIVDAGGREASNPADVTAALDEARNAGRKSVLLRIRTDQSVRFVALPIKKPS